MIDLNEAEIEFARLDRAKVASIVRRLSKAAMEARRMGLTVFGGSGTGSLRWHAEHSNQPDQRPLIIAYLDGSFDGGDGAVLPDELGLERGE